MTMTPVSTDVGLGERRAFPTKAEAKGISPTAQRLDGLIIRITSVADVVLIEKYLSEGRNVLILLPNEWVGLFGGDSKRSLLEAAATVLDRLHVGHIKSHLCDKIYNRENVWWEECPGFPGRLFATEDRFLSDGLFMDGYGNSLENTRVLQALRRDLGLFRKRFLAITLRNSIAAWPCHEPLNLVFDVQNRGGAAESEETLLTFDLPQSFEPIGSTEAQLPPLLPLAKTSVGLQVIPRLDGDFESICGVGAGDTGIEVKFRGQALRVTPRYTTQLRSQSRKDAPGLDRLRRFAATGDGLLDGAALKSLEELATVDPAACLNRMRSLAERLVQRCTGRAGMTFATQIQEIQSRVLLSRKSVGYLHTIRVLGNLASHPSGEQLTSDDVRITAFALSAVLEEMLDRRIL